MDDNSNDSTAQVHTLLREATAGCAFGPAFFAGQLAALVRERCPEPREALPSVQLYLNTGEQLDLCHVIGFAPSWVALAVWENGSDTMRTELVPYESIARVTIAAPRERGARVGFDPSHSATVMAAVALSPEQALRAAAASEPRP